jgi:hypothetical protein
MLWPFGIFSRLGNLHQEKSGNPGRAAEYHSFGQWGIKLIR